MTPQFRDFGGSCPRHDETVETLFPVIFLGRAAENNGGPGDRVHDMRTMWSPYDQSSNLGGPAGKKVGPEDRRVRPDYMTGHRGSTLSSSRGHGLPAQHYFRRLCPKKRLGIGSPQFPHSVDGLPSKSRNCGAILLPSLFSLSPA